MLIPFDILYEGFCNRLRSSGQSEAILQLIKKENNEIYRIKKLLTEAPDLYCLLERNVSEAFVRKDELIAKKLWKRGFDGKSLEILTEALSYCPIPECFEEKVVQPTESEQIKETLQNFVKSPMGEGAADTNIMESIFFARACILISGKQYISALIDFLRAWLLGMSKTLDMTFRVAVCCYECGELQMGKELLQDAAQHLRTLSMPNDEKSVWTMNIVKSLKAIEALNKVTTQNKLADFLQVSTKVEIDVYSQLFSNASATLLGTSDALELKYSQEKGRHIVAKQHIPPGATLIAETPYAWTLSKVNYYKFCGWCLKKAECGLPCLTCASAVFCSLSCRSLAMKTFHATECKVLKLLDSSQKLGNMALLCFRTILSTPMTTVEEFAKIIGQDETIPEDYLMGFNTNKNLESSSYVSVFAQTPNSEQRQAADLLKRTFSAIYLTICLKKVNYFNCTGGLEQLTISENKLPMTEKEIGVAALMLRHLQGSSCNAYGINHIESKMDLGGEEVNKNLQIEEVGGATYPIISTTNHSCDPNAYRINIPGKTCLVKTLREIRQGEEVYDCYGPLYLMEPRQERITKLNTQYLFRCNCQPCSENWPVYADLRKTPIRYKCSSCECELKVDGKNMNNKVKCPYCDKVADMKKLLKDLSVQKERFYMTKTSILAEAFQPFDTDIEAIICNYISMCQKIYLDPCIHNVEAQEILKLFWNISFRNL